MTVAEPLDRPKGTVMEGAYAYDRPDERAEGDRESGVRESVELLHRRVESAMKVVAVLKERLGPIRVNVPRPLPGDENMVKDSSPPRSDHAAELIKLAGEVATLTATLDDVLQTLDI